MGAEGREGQMRAEWARRRAWWEAKGQQRGKRVDREETEGRGAGAQIEIRGRGRGRTVEKIICRCTHGGESVVRRTLDADDKVAELQQFFYILRCDLVDKDVRRWRRFVQFREVALIHFHCPLEQV